MPRLRHRGRHLENLLRPSQRLDKDWDQGFQSEWEGEIGLHDEEDADNFGVS
jgi:hypothetical protein